jgi:two-component system, NtrC family, response regulator HydG
MRIEEQPLLSVGQIEQVLDTIPSPAIILDEQMEIVAANHAYTGSFASFDRRVAGRHCYELSHGYAVPCSMKGEICPLQNAAVEGGHRSVIHEHFKADGKEHEEVTIVPIRNDGGRATLFLETLRPLQVSGGRVVEAAMVGRSRPFDTMMHLIGRVAPSDTPVLLLGESGTGKELAAMEIHRRSRRARGPFVPIDCSGIAPTLFESELLGHEKGAFTGAVHSKKGLVEASRGGTLFLDEVGDVPLDQQVKLLRIIETGMYRRVGCVDQKMADFRLICATHRSLLEMVAEGSFRRDLYYRISAFPVRLPPLRDRIEDLPILAERMLQRLNPRSPFRLDPESLAILSRYPFHGNIRELLNILQRGCLLAEGRTILPEHLPEECFEVAERQAPPAAADDGKDVVSMEAMERRYLSWVLRHFTGDRHELAARLGLSERTLYRKIAMLGDSADIDPEPGRDAS